MNMMVSPGQTFKITGPMMVDGEKQSTHPDISRQKNMNIRTRFLFEFLPWYRPTELLTLEKHSSYTHGDQSSHVAKLKIKGIYGLSLKYDEQGEFIRNKHNQILSENIEEVLLREIVKYENLSPADPKFGEKLRRFYALQIKALQIAGFIQDENTLNRSAVNINGPIPYYDPSSINEIFSSYIKMKKYEIHAEDKRLAELKNFINIRTLPGDTYRQIFTTIAKYVSVLGEANERYPYIRELSRLPDYKKRIFVERFLSSASAEGGFEARKFLENPKPFKNFIVSLDVLETILADIADIKYMDSFPGLSETDQKVIELVSMDESYRQMLTNILAVESYGENESIFSRRNLKKLVKKF